LLDDIRTEAGTLVYPKDSRHTTNDAADHPANNCPDRPSRSFTIPCTPLDSAGDALGLGRNGNEQCGNKGCGSDKIADHDSSLDWGLGERQAASGEKVPVAGYHLRGARTDAPIFCKRRNDRIEACLSNFSRARRMSNAVPREVRSPDAAKHDPGIVSSRPRISLRSIQATSEYVVALILRLGRDFARGIDTQPA
jgi:hypothetical protein